MTTLSSITPNAKLEPNQERGNLNIHFADAKTLAEPIVSGVWELGGRQLQFVQLGADGTLGLDQGLGRLYIKVITGALANPRRLAFCAPRGIQDTLVTDTQIEAGAEGALLAVLTVPDSAPTVINSMDQLAFSGPQAEALHWRTFHEQFSQFMDYFDGMDAYIGPGFHLLDENGIEITYVNIWTAGQGVDLSTHNHGMAPMPQVPTFAEIHWTICNGTGQGGMFECAEPGAERTRYPVQAGEEHGPFFTFDPKTGAPVLRENGAVDYPWHGWQAGPATGGQQTYDLIAAFETAPEYARVER